MPCCLLSLLFPMLCCRFLLARLCLVPLFDALLVGAAPKWPCNYLLLVLVVSGTCQFLLLRVALLEALFASSACSLWWSSALFVPQVKELYNESVEKIRDSNNWALIRPVFTCDLWRSRTRREYSTLTMHWIDVSRPDAGSEWKLRNRILGSIAVTAAKVNHKGEREPSCCDLLHPCVDVFCCCDLWL